MHVDEIRSIEVAEGATQKFSFVAGSRLVRIGFGIRRDVKTEGNTTRVFKLSGTPTEGGSASWMRELNRADLVAALRVVEDRFAGRGVAVRSVSLETTKNGATEQLTSATVEFVTA